MISKTNFEKASLTCATDISDSWLLAEPGSSEAPPSHLPAIEFVCASRLSCSDSWCIVDIVWASWPLCVLDECASKITFNSFGPGCSFQSRPHLVKTLIMKVSFASFAFSFASLAHCVQGLRAAGNSQVAESIGEEVKNIDRQYASHFNRGGFEETSVFGDSIAAGLHSQESVLVNAEVSRVVSEGNALAASEVVGDSDTCSRNLKAPCPNGWLQVGSAHCAAPASYTGGCPRMQSFNGRSLAARLKFASDCEAQWPCATDCAAGLDFDTCPEGWSDGGDGYCSSSGTSKCLPSYKFSAMSISQKEELASVCGFEWPCRASCNQNFNAPCPEGWTNIGDECMGPSTYAGECDFSFATNGMTIAQKQALAESCGVRYPCN